MRSVLLAAHLLFKVPGHFFYFCSFAYYGERERVLVALVHLGFELLCEFE